MRKILLLLLIIILAVGAGVWYNVSAEVRTASPTIAANPDIKVYFSPDGGCTKTITDEIELATKTISMQAYSFTSLPIVNALEDAYKKRHVRVEIVLDKSQRTANGSKAQSAFEAGIPVYIDAKHAIAHNKIIIIDDKVLITGSFNFTKAAEESNAENLLVIKNAPDLVKRYADNYQKHKGHSELLGTHSSHTLMEPGVAKKGG